MLAVQFSIGSIYIKLLIIILFILSSVISRYVRNCILARKIKVLEELLDSKAHCTWYFILSRLKISGKYKGRRIEFVSFPRNICRYSFFYLESSKLPKQKRFIVWHPKIAGNVRQYGSKLGYYFIDVIWSFKLYKLDKDGFIAILDELLRAAEIIE
jgi:hypothetical protein